MSLAVLKQQLHGLVSWSVGAQLVKLACVNFQQVCEENDKEGCMQALNMIECEYCHIRNKFETMVQLEQ